MYCATRISKHFSQDSLSSHPDNSICESNDLQKLKDLTLVDLKVIGVVGKVNFDNVMTLLVCMGIQHLGSNVIRRECWRGRSIELTSFFLVFETQRSFWFKTCSMGKLVLSRYFQSKPFFVPKPIFHSVYAYFKVQFHI